MDHKDCPAPVWMGVEWMCTAHYPPVPVQVERAAADPDLQAKLRAVAPPKRINVTGGMGAQLGATVTALQARNVELQGTVTAQLTEGRALRDRVAEVEGERRSLSDRVVELEAELEAARSSKKRK